MAQPAESERIEVDREQVAAVRLFAEALNISPQEVVRHAIDQYLGTALAAREPAHVDQAVRELQAEASSRRTVKDDTETKAGSNLPEGFISRHPERDYSWFGSLKGEFGDGVEYQKSIRAEW